MGNKLCKTVGFSIRYKEKTRERKNSFELYKFEGFRTYLRYDINVSNLLSLDNLNKR